MEGKDSMLLLGIALNGLKSIRTELSRMSEDVADMVSVLSDVLVEEKEAEKQEAQCTNENQD